MDFCLPISMAALREKVHCAASVLLFVKSSKSRCFVFRMKPKILGLEASVKLLTCIIYTST